jgi:hypothetical protein
MINQSMMPIFNKISDLFKTKVYVDSGPLEQNNHKIQNKTHPDIEEISGGSINNKNKFQNTNSTSNESSIKKFENLEKSEKEILNINKHTNTYPNAFNHNTLNASNADDTLVNLKSEFNVNKININCKDCCLGRYHRIRSGINSANRRIRLRRLWNYNNLQAVV